MIRTVQPGDAIPAGVLVIATWSSTVPAPSMCARLALARQLGAPWLNPGGDGGIPHVGAVLDVGRPASEVLSVFGQEGVTVWYGPHQLADLGKVTAATAATSCAATGTAEEVVTGVTAPVSFTGKVIAGFRQVTSTTLGIAAVAVGAAALGGAVYLALKKRK